MNQTPAFEEAVKTMANIRAAAAAGDEEAVRLLKMADANSPAFVLADISKYRPQRG